MHGTMLVIKADGTIERTKLAAPPHPDEITKAIGENWEKVLRWDRWVHWHEGVIEHNGPIVALCNEDGIRLGLPLNEYATKEWHAEQSRTGYVLDDVLLGNVLVLFGDSAFMRAL